MVYESQAYLTLIRNVDRGLRTRTLIIKALKSGCTSIGEVSKTTGLKYQTILKHIKKMEEEGIVVKRGEKPVKWLLTDRGQRSILIYGT
ncbi:MAG: winged helix-turn-helix domain-containing protein [Candidatus Bathyarchaeia archaeon]